jgi:site-specific recombinase XerD
VTATNELMVELARYRRELGLAPFPISNEAMPLLLPIGGKLRMLSRGAVHELVKAVFEKTADRIRLQGPEQEAKAQRIIQASTHWLRHTAGSHMANKAVDLRHVRDNLGHESLTTTSGYLHSSDDDRHRETEEKHKIAW